MISGELISRMTKGSNKQTKDKKNTFSSDGRDCLERRSAIRGAKTGKEMGICKASRSLSRKVRIMKIPKRNLAMKRFVAITLLSVLFCFFAGCSHTGIRKVRLSPSAGNIFANVVRKCASTLIRIPIWVYMTCDLKRTAWKARDIDLSRKEICLLGCADKARTQVLTRNTALPEF